ncbi:unnamed protein product [Allacma fusca]|uniref:Uncharacterized protein n=1 Tax=Allacma fusca TaxID=39272 RepID=A0A8J2PBD1_9HEXA|nr:unnamed protein product [Allacma fusca]
MGFSKFSVGVILLGVLYSTSFCDTSDILSVLKPNHSSSSSSSHHHKKVHEYPSKIRDGASVPSDPKAKTKTTVPKVTTKFPILVSNSTWNSTSEARHMMTGSSGWGWPSSSSNMDLYSLLGGMSFLGLILFLFIFLSAARSSSSTPTIILAGKRRKRDAKLPLNEDLIGETVSEILDRLGLSLDTPWWNGQEAMDKTVVTPIKYV